MKVLHSHRDAAHRIARCIALSILLISASSCGDARRSGLESRSDSLQLAVRNSTTTVERIAARSNALAVLDTLLAEFPGAAEARMWRELSEEYLRADRRDRALADAESLVMTMRRHHMDQMNMDRGLASKDDLAKLELLLDDFGVLLVDLKPAERALTSFLADYPDDPEAPRLEALRDSLVQTHNAAYSVGLGGAALEVFMSSVPARLICAGVCEVWSKAIDAGLPPDKYIDDLVETLEQSQGRQMDRAMEVARRHVVAFDPGGGRWSAAHEALEAHFLAVRALVKHARHPSGSLLSYAGQSSSMERELDDLAERFQLELDKASSDWEASSK